MLLGYSNTVNLHHVGKFGAVADIPEAVVEALRRSVSFTRRMPKVGYINKSKVRTHNIKIYSRRSFFK